jgi:branched-chain amino acid transport system permease protein
VAIGLGLSALPALGPPAFYESFLYLVFSWIALATSWSILSGYAGYFSFGHGAFFGAGMYTTATLAAGFGVPFLATLPVAGVLAALLATGIGAVVFRVKRLRGELFGLLTLAITFVLATIVLNTRIDGGPGVYLLGVAIPRLVASPAGTIYLLGLALAVATLCVAHRVWRSRFGLGLFAIHDDEDVAEVKGVPTFRYKLLAFALSAGIAGVAGGVHAVYVSYVTVGETFAITVPLYVVLMSILGGARHWLGPAVGAAIITASLYAFTRGEAAVIGRAVVAFALILVILLLPEGIVPAVIRRWRAVRGVGPRPAAARAAESGAAAAAGPRTATGPRPDDDARRSPLARDRLADTTPIPWDERRAEGATGPGPPDVAGRPGRMALRCEDVDKSFGGIRALRGVSLHVEGGEIVGLVGPNGSGKTTLINLISGHHAADRGRIALGGTLLSGRPAHQIAGLGISRTYQIPRPFNHLTVLENVVQAATFGAEARSLGQARAEAREWLEFAGLARRASALPPELNLHERKFLELGRALAARPRVILLDEVLAGLNPGEIASAIRLVRGIREAGTSILFVEHVMRAVLELSDRVVVLNEGEVIAAGPPREAMRDPHVVRVYLGKTHAA